MRRILNLVLLLPTSVLTVFCFTAYANVVDTMSMKMGSFFMCQLFFWMACGGAALLFIGQVLRLFAARWMLVASLGICPGFTLFSIVAYPAGYDAPRAPLALSHSLQELHAILAMTVLLLMLAMLEPRMRGFVTRSRADL